MRQPFYIIASDSLQHEFPDVDKALQEPDGLLAIGGDLGPDRLLDAYRRGIFPWYSDDTPIYWWSPNPRTVLFPDRLKVSRSLRKTLRKDLFTVTLDRDFTAVIDGCAAPRRDSHETWITTEMRTAYLRLHQLGRAHSVECWQNGQLVGGLYGVALGRVFFGESMFSRVSDASKVAFVRLVEFLDRHDFQLLDCQLHTPHLQSMGASQIARRNFIALLDTWANDEAATLPPASRWDIGQ